MIHKISFHNSLEIWSCSHTVYNLIVCYHYLYLAKNNYWHFVVEWDYI